MTIFLAIARHKISENQIASVSRARLQPKVLGFLLGCACLLYLRGFTGSAYLQPSLYFFGILGACLHCLKKTDHVSISLFWLAIIAQIILSMQFFLLGHQLHFLNEIGRVVYPFLVAFTGSALAFNYDERRLSIAVSFFIKTISVLLLADAFVRLIQNGVWPVSVASRYDIKSGGLLFPDSNFNGFLAGFVLLFMRNTKLPIKKSSWMVASLTFLVVVSASLAAYAGILIALLVGLLGPRISIIVSACSISAILFLMMQNQVNLHAALMSVDGSLATKFLIAQEAWVRIWSGDILLTVFGSGSGLLKESFQFASHNFIGLASELGIVFVVAYFSFALFLFMNLHHHLTTFVFLGMVGGISLLPIAYMACVYFLLAVEARFERKRAGRFI